MCLYKLCAFFRQDWNFLIAPSCAGKSTLKSRSTKFAKRSLSGSAPDPTSLNLTRGGHLSDCRIGVLEGDCLGRGLCGNHGSREMDPLLDTVRAKTITEVNSGKGGPSHFKDSFTEV